MGVKDHVMKTHVKRRGEKMKRMMTIYDQRDVRTGE